MKGGCQSRKYNNLQKLPCQRRLFYENVTIKLKLHINIYLSHVKRSVYNIKNIGFIFT